MFDVNPLASVLTGDESNIAPSVAAVNDGLGTKASSTHDHDDAYDAIGTAAEFHAQLVDALEDKAPLDHNHDSAYSAIGHDHDADYEPIGAAAAAVSALGLGTASTYDVPVSGDAASGEVVLGNDSRLSGGSLPGMLPGLSYRAVYQPSGAVQILIGAMGGTPTTYAAANRSGHFRQMIFDEDRLIDFCQVCVRTAGSIAGTVCVAIYEVAATGGPGIIVGQSDAATVPTVAGPIDLTWTTPCPVEAGVIYWVGFKPEHSGTNPQWACLTADTSLNMGAAFLTAASNTCNPVTGLYKLSMTAGAFPADMTATDMAAHYNTAIPWVGFEI